MCIRDRPYCGHGLERIAASLRLVAQHAVQQGNELLLQRHRFCVPRADAQRHALHLVLQASVQRAQRLLQQGQRTRRRTPFECPRPLQPLRRGNLRSQFGVEVHAEAVHVHRAVDAHTVFATSVHRQVQPRLQRQSAAAQRQLGLAVKHGLERERGGDRPITRATRRGHEDRVLPAPAREEPPAEAGVQRRLWQGRQVREGGRDDHGVQRG